MIDEKGEPSFGWFGLVRVWVMSSSSHQAGKVGTVATEKWDDYRGSGGKVYTPRRWGGGRGRRSTFC